MLGLGVVGLDFLLTSENLLDVTIVEHDGELGVGRVLVAGAEPGEVGQDGDDAVPVEDQKQVDQVERLADGQVVQDEGLVGLNLIESASNGGRDVQVQGGGHLGDNLNDLESGWHHEGREHDCLVQVGCD